MGFCRKYAVSLLLFKTKEPTSPPVIRALNALRRSGRHDARCFINIAEERTLMTNHASIAFLARPPRIVCSVWHLPTLTLCLYAPSSKPASLTLQHRGFVWDVLDHTIPDRKRICQVHQDAVSRSWSRHRIPTAPCTLGAFLPLALLIFLHHDTVDPVSSLSSSVNAPQIYRTHSRATASCPLTTMRIDCLLACCLIGYMLNGW